MYSYGSSARATGKRGHGGRNYLPPPERNSGSAPPPLKQCDCLVELDLVEYQTTQERRLNASFGGRDTAQELIKTVRSKHLCHLEIPGRSKTGPVGIVGRTMKRIIPAAFAVIHQLVNIRQVRARVHPHVKTQAPVLEGNFYYIERAGIFFESPLISIASCRLSSPDDLENLQALLDNFQFRDAAYQFEILVTSTVVFAIGDANHVQLLMLEVLERFVNSDG